MNNETLTPEKLKAAKFGLRQHLNGGNKFSSRTDGNDEWGIAVTTETDGSPHYNITAKTLSVDGTSIAIDMRKKPVDLEGFCQQYNEWRSAHPQGPQQAAEARTEELDSILAAHEKAKADRATEMPDESAALAVMFRAHQRLKELGWRDAIYCPKDGKIFKAIEAGSTGIHDCRYDGEWPTGSWWLLSDDDAYPSRPILYKDATTNPPATSGAGGERNLCIPKPY